MAKDEISDFGGLVSTLTPNLLDLGEATKAEFCDVTDGVLESAFGRMLAATLSGDITTIYDWRRAGAASIILVFTTTNIYRVAMTFSGATPTSILPGGGYTISGTRAWSITPVTIFSKLVATNGVDPPLEWDGVAATMSVLALPAGVTVPQFVLWWKNRLHLLGVTDGGVAKLWRHWWSQPLTYNAWSTVLGAGFLDYSGGDEPFTGVADLENFFVIFKQNRLVIVSATGVLTVPFANRELDNIRGTYAPFSIQVTDRGVFYLAVDGLRLFTGTESILVSAHVDAFSAIPVTALTSASSVLDPIFQRYLVAFPSVAGGINDKVWVALYQFYPKEKVEFTSRTYANGIRSLGRIIRSQSFTWQDFGVAERWIDTVISWNNAQTVGEFDELISGGYAGSLCFYESGANDLGAAIPMDWTSGVLPKDIGLRSSRVIGLTINAVPSVASELIVELLDAENNAVRFTKTLSLGDINKRTHAVYPNRSFRAGFLLRFRNALVGSVVTVSQARYWTVDGSDFRQ